MRHSVPGYNIYDGDGSALYDGDIVMKHWGGGNDGQPYRSYCFHKLSISRTGALKISNCANIVRSFELLKVAKNDRLLQARGIDKYFKEYY